jgi:hypothetical protein
MVHMPTTSERHIDCREITDAFNTLVVILELAVTEGEDSTKQILGAIAHDERWQTLGSATRKLSTEKHGTFTKFQMEVENLLHALKAPSRQHTREELEHYRDTADRLRTQWETWADQTRPTAGGLSRLWSFCRRYGSSLIATGTLGVASYFVLRAIGDVTLDSAQILYPQEGEYLVDHNATSDNRTASSIRRQQLLTEYRNFLFDSPNRLVPNLRNSFGKIDQSLLAQLTPTQMLYDSLGQLSPSNRMVFAFHFSNHSYRGARAVGEVKTRLTLLESLTFPWQELDLSSELKCEIENERIPMLISQSIAPAVNVNWKIQNDDGRLLRDGAANVVDRTGLKFAGIQNGFVQLLYLKAGDRLANPDLYFPLRDAPNGIPESEVARDWRDAINEQKKYFVELYSPPTVDRSTSLVAKYLRPITKSDLLKYGVFTPVLNVNVEWEDLKGKKYSKLFHLQAPPNAGFFIAQDLSIPEMSEEEDESSDRQFSAPDTTSETGRNVAAAAVDTLDRSEAGRGKEFLYTLIGLSGSALHPSEKLEHHAAFHAQLAPGGELLVAGYVKDAPAGRYELEVIIDGKTLASRRFVYFPLRRFADTQKQIWHQFQSPQPEENSSGH